MKNISFEDSRKLQYEMLKEIASFCSKNNIKYYLACGTLLGAVRHGAYIPWDDDTDVYMPRPDYDEFLKKYKETSNFIVYTYKNEKDYFYTFGRMRNKKTFDLQGKKRLPGISVDIYPIDGLPDSEEEVKKHMQKIFKYRDVETILTRWYGRFNRYYVPVVNFFLRPIIKFNAKKIEELITKYSYSDSVKVSNLCDSKRIYNKSFFGDGVAIQFEDSFFIAPTDYEEILKRLYGNYMQLPPEDKRVPNHWGNYYYY